MHRLRRLAPGLGFARAAPHDQRCPPGRVRRRERESRRHPDGGLAPLWRHLGRLRGSDARRSPARRCVQRGTRGSARGRAHPIHAAGRLWAAVRRCRVCAAADSTIVPQRCATCATRGPFGSRSEGRCRPGSATAMLTSTGETTGDVLGDVTTVFVSGVCHPLKSESGNRVPRRYIVVPAPISA
jgi:hypothetical protein